MLNMSRDEIANMPTAVSQLSVDSAQTPSTIDGTKPPSPVETKKHLTKTELLQANLLEAQRKLEAEKKALEEKTAQQKINAASLEAKNNNQLCKNVFGFWQEKIEEKREAERRRQRALEEKIPTIKTKRTNDDTKTEQNCSCTLS
jgi:hypothetical protein